VSESRASEFDPLRSIRESLPLPKQATAICAKCGAEFQFNPGILRFFKLATTSDKILCPECFNERMAAEEAQKEAARQATVSARRRQWRVECGIPRKFQGQDFSTFEQKRQAKAFKRCWEYADKFPLVQPEKYNSLVLMSPHCWGVGKTHLACSIAHLLLDRWQGEEMACPVKFISEPDLFSNLMETYSFTPEEKHYRESETDIIHRLSRVKLLVLDDVGKVKFADLKFVQRILFAIINKRYDNELPLVMTTNLDKEELCGWLGEASFDRLVEMCRGSFFQMTGESYRRAGNVG